MITSGTSTPIKSESYLDSHSVIGLNALPSFRVFFFLLVYLLALKAIAIDADCLLVVETLETIVCVDDTLDCALQNPQFSMSDQELPLPHLFPLSLLSRRSNYEVAEPVVYEDLFLHHLRSYFV
jgi:hypothetical protein